MKFYNEFVDVIAAFEYKKTPLPMRMKHKGKLYEVIVIESNLERLAGVPVMAYKCRTIANGRETYYTIKYELQTMQWRLYSMN